MISSEFVSGNGEDDEDDKDEEADVDGEDDEDDEEDGGVKIKGSSTFVLAFLIARFTDESADLRRLGAMKTIE
jgi:hypothetical protein